jgi:hypothetical protein
MMNAQMPEGLGNMEGMHTYIAYLQSFKDQMDSG